MNSLNSPIPETGQEVRFAVAMSGGVSLAVWMGGVAREMNLLQEASNLRQSGYLPVSVDGSRSGSAGAGTDARQKAYGWPGTGSVPSWDTRCRDLYRRLMELLNVTVTMDVLSGTSGGGINAALLGLSSAAGVDLGGLRDLWIRTGSLDTLLRNPLENHPPSLLQGDRVLFTQLNNGIRDLYASRTPEYRLRAAGRRTAPPGTSVFITTTMMSGETGRFTDDYGTLVPDIDHHGLFTFDEEALGAGGAPALTALALAARCSAAFPGAFEPSFVPINSWVAAGAGVPERPDMAEFANATRSHWAADGGLLANRPLTPLLAKVFAQPATGQVRRVLAFVVPDGGGTASASARPVLDDWAFPPPLAEALKADLGAQESQSIASDLQAARVHNERIDARHGLRRSLADLGSRLRSEDQQPAESPPSDGLVDGRLLGEFERQQGVGLAQPLLAEVMRQLSTMQIPAAWAAQFTPEHQAETPMVTAMVHILGRGWHQARPPGGGPAVPAAAAPPAADEEVAAWAAWTAATDPVGRAAMFGLPVFYAARALVVHLVQRGYQRATDLGLRSKLAGHREAIEDLSGLLPPGWTDERYQVRAYLERTMALGKDGHYGDLRAVVADLAEQKRQALRIGEEAADLRDAWAALASVTQSLLADLPPLSAPGGRASRIDAAKAIGVYQRYFGQAPGPAQLADLLLKLVLAERALLPANGELDQPVEFVQFSANTRTLLAPSDMASGAPPLDTVSKLRGVEFHHFAAFYKSSWRVWDWMWGRLDGSGWLVHILLDPRRILAVVENQPEQYPQGRRATTFAARLREAAGLPADLPGDCLEGDLAFLDDPTADIPVSLPNSALFVAQAWQNLIAANELPVIAEQMLAYGTQDPWAAKVLSMRPQAATPQEFARELSGCPVRQETLAGEEELGTPLFTRMTTRTISLALRTFRPPAYLTGPLASLGSGPIAQFTGLKFMGQFASSIASFRGGSYALPAALAVTAAGAIASTSTIVALSAVGLVIELGGLLLVIASAARRISITFAVVALAAGSALIAAGFIPFIHNHLFLWLEKTALPALAKHPALWAIVVTLLLLPSLWTIMEIVRRAIRQWRTRRLRTRWLRGLKR
jgi:patatin-related protein